MNVIDGVINSWFGIKLRCDPGCNGFQSLPVPMSVTVSMILLLLNEGNMFRILGFTYLGQEPKMLCTLMVPKYLFQDSCGENTKINIM